MLRSIWLLLIYIMFLGLGTQAPFVLALGYVWVDAFVPQSVAYIILNQIQVALIMGAAAFGAYFLLDRKYPPGLTLVTVLQFTLAAWVCLTLLWAVAPDAALDKWNWAFKTLAFASFIPFFIRSRVQIEAFIQVFVLSLMANIVPFGAKILISGGGYGRQLGLAGGNAGLSEGATLAAVSVMTIPLLLFLRRHAQLVPKSRVFGLMYIGLVVAAVATTIGTYERTGLVGLAVLAILMIVRSRHKILALVVSLGAAIVVAYIASNAWFARISTIETYQKNNSAFTRILVWRWTWKFAMSHPLGGGFMAYLVDHIEFPPTVTHPGGFAEFARAFHSLYFEVLGEQGFPGLALYLMIAIASLVSLQRVIRQSQSNPDLLWYNDLARALQMSTIVLLVCGAFIGIAFQPWLHYLFGVSVSVSECVRRVLAGSTDRRNPTAVGEISWRNRAQAGPVRYGRSGPTAGR